MKTIEEMYDNAINNWRNNKGVGTAIIPPPLDYRPFVIGILQRIYSRSPTVDVLIIVQNFEERSELINALTHQPYEENNEEIKKLIDDKHLRIYTVGFLEQMRVSYDCILTILVHPDSIHPASFSKLNLTKFKLVILDRLFSNNADSATLQRICPTLSDFQQNEIIALRTNTPVEETLVGIPVTNTEVRDKLDRYDNYINESVTIFGSFDIMDKAHRGDKTLNISANQMCYNIACENGWNEHLDMSFPFNVQIDKMYNPNSLQERVGLTYEAIRNRSNLVTDYEGKLDKILEIVNKHSDKKILIINKRGEFASVVSDFLNNSKDEICCLPYHDKLAPISLTDDAGQPILIKTGSHKGEPKIIAQKAQKTLNQKRFNEGRVNVLSTNASPDRDLQIDVQVIIITSPKCNSVEEYIYRLGNVCFPDNKIILYTLYCEDSLEESSVMAKEDTLTHKIVNKFENINIFAENSCVRIGI